MDQLQRPDLMARKSHDSILTAQFNSSAGTIPTISSKNQLSSSQGGFLVPPNLSTNLKIKNKKILLVKFEGTLVAVPNRTETFGYLLEDPSKSEDNGLLKISRKFVFPRPGLKSFMENLASMYNVYVYSSFKHKVLQALIREQGLQSYIKGSIGDITTTETISGIVLGTELQGKTSPDRTILLDSDKQIIHLNSQQGILISPTAVGSQDNDLYQCLGFLAYLTQQADIRPIFGHYQAYLKLSGSFLLSTSQQEVDETYADDTESVGTEGFVPLDNKPVTDPDLMKKLKDRIERDHMSRAKILNRYKTNPSFSQSKTSDIFSESLNNTTPIMGYSSVFSRNSRHFL